MSIALIFKIAMIGLTVTILNGLLTKYNREEYAMMTTIVGLLIVLFMVLPLINDLFQMITSLFQLY